MPFPRVFTTVLACLLSLALQAQVPPALPLPVASFGAAASADGRLFIYGGHSGVRHSYSREEVNGDLYTWKPGAAAWDKLGTNEPAQGASLLFLPGRVLRIGGMAAHNAKGQKQDLRSTDTASSFDLAGKTWTALPWLPEPRSSHDSTVAGGTLYVIGGWALGERGTVWHDTYLTLNLTHPKAAWESHSQPFKRRALAVQALGSKIYAIGGMDEGDKVSRDVRILDTATGKWSAGPELPANRLGGFGFSAVAHQGRLFASGAIGDLLELRGNEWVAIARLTHARYFHRLLPAGQDQLVALGGETGPGEKTPPEIIPLPAPDSPALPDPSAGSDWPGYQGPRGNSTTPETNWSSDWPADGPPLAWKAEVGAGLASVAITNNHVYATGNDGHDQDTIFCLDLNDGRELWKQVRPVPTRSHEMPIVPNGPAATPCVNDGRLYVTSREGGLLCLEAETGKQLWARSLIKDLGGKRPVYGYAGSPRVFNGRLYLDTGGNGKSTTCLNATDGAVIWQTDDGEAGYSTPEIVVHEGREVLVMFKGEALELRAPADGRLIASHATTTRDYCNAATPLLIGDTLFISHTGNMGARAMEWKGDALKERWTNKDLGLLFQSGLPWKHSALVFNDQVRGTNDLRLIDIETGKALWRTNEVAKGTGLLCDDGRAILLTNLGEVVLLNLKAGTPEILQRFQALTSKCWCQPVLSHGRLLCKNNAGAVVCYKIEAKK